MSNMETDGRKREKGEFGGTMVAILFILARRAQGGESKLQSTREYLSTPAWPQRMATPEHSSPRGTPKKPHIRTTKVNKKIYLFIFSMRSNKKERVDVDVCQLQIQSVNVMMPAHVRVYACEGRTHTLRAGNPNSVYKTYSREKEENIFTNLVFCARVV